MNDYSEDVLDQPGTFGLSGALDVNPIASVHDTDDEDDYERQQDAFS